MDSDDNDSVDDFLAKVKQLEIKTKEEDMRRSQRLKDELSSSYSRRTFNLSRDIIIPKPVARNDDYGYKLYKSDLANSESIRNFNSQISDEYKVDLEDLKYESAYNFERSGNYYGYQGNVTKPLQDTHVINEEYGTSISKPRPRSPERKPTEIPEIIRFEDFITKTTGKPTSRYSKFQITDEQKSKINKTLNELIGNEDTVSEDEDQENQENYEVQPLKRSQKGSSISRDWTSAAKLKPKLTTPISFNKLSPSLSLPPQSPTHQFSENELDSNNLKEYPRKKDLSYQSQLKEDSPLLSPSPSRTPSASPIKRSPARINFSKLYSESKLEVKSMAQPFKPKPPVKNAWLSSVMQNSTSTIQGLSTDSKIQLNKPAVQNSWLNSAKDKAPSSTTQGLSTESKINISKSTTQNTWLDSAKKRAPKSHQFIEKPTNKIKIQTNGVNTLTKNLSAFEEMSKKRTSTLEELNSRKLNHVDDKEITKSSEPMDTEPSFSPITLKKTRPSKTSKPEHLGPEFANQKLSTAKLVERKVSEESEALKKPQTLKPVIKAERKVSEEPEAFKKFKSLKPALPIRKPSYKIPEALEKINNLKHSQDSTSPTKEEDPEGLVKLKNLAPAKPIRKPSVQEVEALKNLKKIKAKGSASSQPPVKAKSARVVSQSRELLQSQIGRLKSLEKNQEMIDGEPENRKETSDPEVEFKDPKKNYISDLENLILKRANTDLNPLSSVKSFSITHDTTMLKKASTFDTSKSTEMKLDHINKTRVKGPKKRVPKSLQ